MLYSLKYISIFAAGVLIGFMVGIGGKRSIVLEKATEVYKEVAHIPPSSYNNATLIYTDAENDIAYYVATDRIQEVTCGDTLYLDNGDAARVTEVDLRGFYLDVSECGVRAGMSGTPIWCDDEIVGYISSLHNQNTLYCIWAN